MNLLVDTQALIWALNNNAQLSPTARRHLENPQHRRCVSMATGWEMAIKISLGKLAAPVPLPTLFPTLLLSYGFHLLPIQSSHLHRLLDLPFHHRDPFDRLLIAQVLEENLAVISSDAAFDAYGVIRIW